jgi:hypothetical protein
MKIPIIHFTSELDSLGEVIVIVIFKRPLRLKDINVQNDDKTF